MYRLKSVVFLLVFFLFFSTGLRQAGAWPWGEKSLVTINGQEFSIEDFKHWWENWSEEGISFPETLDPFIEWHLLVQEAESMELYTLPEYQRKLQTFLRVRSLMKLKYDEIDSQIHIDEKEVRERYNQECCPRYRVEIIGFERREDAVEISGKLNAGSLSVEDLLEQPVVAGGTHYHGSQWLRAGKISKDWQEALAGLAARQTTPPLKKQDGFVILYLYEIGGPDEADYEKLKDNYMKEAWSAAQWRLTDKLVRDLRKKYNVTIDKELYNSISVDNVPSEILDKELVSMDAGSIKVREFARIFQKEQRVINRDLATAELLQERKDITLANILAQTLTSREAMDRHYEKTPPIKWIYDFYTQHRLITELESRLFRGKARPTEEEIGKYYKEHLQEFGRSGHVTLKRVVADEKLVAKMWAEINRGEDFETVVTRYYSFETPSEVTPLDRLGPELKEVVQKLSNGQVSPPFSTQGHANLIKLIDRQPSSIIPLAEVSGQISNRLQDEKFKRLRVDYLSELKSRSEISFNRKKWETIKSELGS